MTTIDHPRVPGSGRPRAAYDEETRARLAADAAQVVARYPDSRSALLPLLHLVQSEDGYVSPAGVAFCAQTLDLSTAQVSAVATFYTQYKRRPNGEYTVGVCTNTLCAIMGGDAIWEDLTERLGVGNDETTADGKITLERIECNAACDFAPVMMINWEFFDNQTPESAAEVVGKLIAGEPVAPTRGPSRVQTFKQVSRVLAGFSDGLADEGVAAGPATLRGLELARERGWSAPALDGSDAPAAGNAGHAAPAAEAPAAASAPQPGGTQSSVDRPAAGAPERTAEQEKAEHRADDTSEPAGDAAGSTDTPAKES
ncbi:NADH-quinone oxidoreductase subunit NuoE [Cellulomonas sp. C5510]|uniref:NADH-quinone oxidoreductase subunit NuoE n=1 Tax=Cellulomonas sp. C5510 TaxID=2871170 RepID=UPI001C95611F|nr:NADH-quinone oxidoreductase subunit NuoE [Cellulomonas sp. C5510]QZN85992.1 NADH-quinone oxidoreductase subunit NuoE [Cellulomonas sp. C5510]